MLHHETIRLTTALLVVRNITSGQVIVIGAFLNIEKRQTACYIAAKIILIGNSLMLSDDLPLSFIVLCSEAGRHESEWISILVFLPKESSTPILYMLYLLRLYFLLAAHFYTV